MVGCAPVSATRRASAASKSALTANPGWVWNMFGLIRTLSPAPSSDNGSPSADRSSSRAAETAAALGTVGQVATNAEGPAVSKICDDVTGKLVNQFAN